MDKAVRKAVQELESHGFNVDASHGTKIRVTHPASSEVGWINTGSPGERYCKNFVRQMFRRHGVVTEQDKRKRNGQAVKERRAAEAAKAAEQARQAAEQARQQADQQAEIDASAERDAASEARALVWHRQHRVTGMGMTMHAASRALDMALAEDELREVFEHPQRVYYTHKYDAWILSRGRYALSVRVEDGVGLILTVLWSRDRHWRADFETYGEYDNRTLRDTPPD